MNRAFKIFIIILLLPLAVSVFRSTVINFSSYTDIDAAIDARMRMPMFYGVRLYRAALNGQVSRRVTELTVINGEEGIVYIGIGDNNSITAFNFHIRESNGETSYRIGSEIALYIGEIWVRKINTAPGSTEQVFFGMERESAQEFAERTGKEVNFVAFMHFGTQHELWYMISSEGFPDLPEYRTINPLTGTAFYRNPTRDRFISNIGTIIWSLVVIGVILVIYRHKIKNKKLKQQE